MRAAARGRWQGAALVLGLALAFFAAALVHLWPELSTPFAGLPHDDWTDYHQHALDILEHGLAMPGLAGPYTLPAGFLYNYFVALCYALLGPWPARVYLAQAALLGASAGLLYLAFARDLARPGRWALAAGLVLFAYLDVYRNYTFRLLSENLCIFELAVFFPLLRLGYQDGRRWARVLALAWLGPLYLTRPNLLPLIPLICAWLAWTQHHKKGLPWADLAWGLGLMALSVSLLGWRNWWAGGPWVLWPPVKWQALAADHLPTPWYWLEHPLRVATALGRRLLFTLGFLPVLKQAYHYRPHWMLMWAAYLGVALWRLVRRQPLPFMEKALHLYVLAALLVVVGISYIDNYGFRFLAPVTLPAVAGAAPLADILARRRVEGG